ncbi:MAG TPA: beta/gamma crystallin-related protein [Brevundimonas sp.]|uniref:beta/gamma crystallin-related protein n=1 Tax=Brevundimonas sp. TaxID=1871086 RepID=UPI002DF36D90|nr:beta/gamma crystallin-related protein [Brevundimonas sp.]
MPIVELAAAAVLSLSAQDPAYAQDPGAQRAAPRGSYRDSCQEEYVNRGRLYADCRDRQGRLRGTSIELAQCGPYNIANDDGRLVCGPHRGQYEDRPGRPGGGWGDDRPGGGWGQGGRGSAVIYTDATFRGASQRVDGEVPNLANTGFNDRISSMQLRGQWEVCTDAWFRGYCETFDGDLRNLSSTVFNDRISSMRPVRRGGGGRW